MIRLCVSLIFCLLLIMSISAQNPVPTVTVPQPTTNSGSTNTNSGAASPITNPPPVIISNPVASTPPTPHTTSTQQSPSSSSSSSSAAAAAVPTQPSDPTSADLNRILIVDPLNDIIDFNPSQFPGTLNFLPTLQPGVVTQGVTAVTFTATAVNNAATMTIKVNTLDTKPYTSGSPIQVALAEITTKNSPTTIAIGVTSVDGKTVKNFSILIPPDGQAAINSAALCLVNQNQCLIMPANADSMQSAAGPSTSVNDASMSSSMPTNPQPLQPKTLSLGDNPGFVHLLIILASITGFFTMINVVLYYHQSKAAIMAASSGKVTSTN